MELPKPLLDSVPIPKIKEPFAVSDPPSGTEGNWISTPLLSVANIATGFGNWFANGT